MTLLDNKRNICRQLEEFRDRVYSASPDGDPKKRNYYMFYEDDNDGQSNADDKLPLFQVIKAIQQLINDGELTITHEWVELFLARVERTMRGMPEKFERACWEENDDFLTKYFVKPWKLYLDESRYILTDWEWIQNDDDKDILIRYENVKKYEDQLNQRKFQSESIHGQQKTFLELCEEYHSLLVEYLVHCIRFHSSIPVHSYNDDDRYSKNINDLTVNQSLSTVAMPLQPFALTFENISLLSTITDEQNRNVAPFIPSQKEKTVQTITKERLHTLLRAYRWVLILGDPGCGKTTLLRWIVLQLARLIVRRIQCLNDVKEQIDKWQRLAIRFNVDKIFRSSFRIRLPILIRTSELISWLHLHPNSTIMDYIGYQTWFTVPYLKNGDGSFLREFIYHGHAFLLFDGLDEVSSYDERKMIIKLIEEFVEKYVRTPIHISVNDQKNVINEWGNINCEQPKYVGGNQIIITSRIIGYSLYPIKLTMLELFILQTMDKEESQAFIDHYLMHFRTSINRNQSKGKGVKGDRIIRKNKESQIKKLLSQFNENILSHPMLVSLILPILYGTTVSIDQLQRRIRLFELTVQYALNTFIILFKSHLDKETIYCLLCNMATYIHTHSPSGLIDTFDLTNLFYVSLTKLYEYKKIHKTKECLKKYAQNLVSVLTNHSIGFIAARGLDAYGFSHLIFQEYFVTLEIINSYNQSTDSIIDRLLRLTTKPRFREPLILAMEWISLNWQSDHFDKFCLQLLEKVIGPFPIGALFLSSVLEHLANIPGLHILSRLSDILMNSSISTNNFVYLMDGLMKANVVSLLIEHLFDDSTNTTRLCYFFALYLVKRKHDTFPLLRWLSKNDFLRLESSIDTCESHMTIVDSIFYYMSNASSCDRLQLSNELIDILRTKTSIIHPAILSILITLCGGLYHSEINVNFDDYHHYQPKPIQFDSNRMHRSTPLSDILLTYFTNDQTMNSNERLEYLIKQCHEIIVSASIDDISRRIVDAFIALICLQGLDKLTFYGQILQYRALPRALYRMRLALYQTRQFYRVKSCFAFQPGSLPLWTKPSKVEGCQILENIITESKVDISTVNSFSIAMCAAFTRLFFHDSLTNVSWNQPLPISLLENERLLQNIASFSAEMLHLMLNLYSKDMVDDEIKWNSQLHVFQLYRKHPLFPIAFISSKLRPIFERLISRKQSENRETVPFVVVLVEVLLSLDETFRQIQCEQPLKVVLILHLLEDDIHQYELESYSKAIIHDGRSKANINDWHFSDSERSITKADSENALKVALHEERERAQRKSDIQLFIASIGLLRLIKSLKNTYDEVFEEANEAALSIGDPVLRILCLHYMRKIVCSCVSTTYYNTLQEKIIDALEDMSVDDKSLLVLSLILGTCIEEPLHPSMKRLMNFIWIKLQNEPTCNEERLDQVAAFQLIRCIVGYPQLPLPYSFLTRPDLFQQHSPIFHTVFQKMTFNSSETILMAQLYLAEVTVDAQILIQFTHETGSLPKDLPSSHIENILKYSWEVLGKFSHKQVILINNLVLSSEPQLEDIPFNKLLDCTGFEEEKDRSIVESWLQYHNDEQRSKVAVLAVFLLIRSEGNMTSDVLSMVETIWQKGLLSKVNTIRQGARACFSFNQFNWGMFYREWSTPMWQLLRNLMINSLRTRFTTLALTTTDRMMNLLKAERQRLSMRSLDDLYSQFSLLVFVRETFNNDGSDIQIHLNKTLMTEEYPPDLYIAHVIFHIVRECREEEWCNQLFEFLHKLLYNIKLSSTQLATIYALASQKKGREMLLGALDSYFNSSESSTADDQNILSEPQLVACFLALTDSHDGISSIESLNGRLRGFWYPIEKESVCVQRHFQACLFSHLRDEDEQDLSIIQSLFDLTYQEVYNLYMINTSYFILEWRERIEWISQTAKFIVSHNHEVLAQFIDDLYVYLSTENKSSEFQNPEPNYLAVASLLAEKNDDLFCRAVRNSDFGEENFRNLVYRFNKRGITIDQKDMCFELYTSFEILTKQFVKMTFDLCLQDFSNYQYDVFGWCRKITVANREDIEAIFPYLKSSSMYQRRLAVSWLLHLVELDMLSIAEMYQLVSDKYIWEMTNENKEFNQFYEWNRLMSLRPLSHYKHFSVLLPDEVNADFEGVIDAPYLQFT